jgi:hypothetical protein
VTSGVVSGRTRENRPLQRSAGNGRVAQLLRHTGQAVPTGPRRPGVSPPRRSLQRILDDNGTKLGPEDDTDLVNGLASNLERESPALARQFREAVRNPQDLGAFDA